jgi:saccharopine dehydrogenase (NAD+, L-lysine-forming)
MKTRIGIRREDKNPWERRVPLIPSHVRELLENSPLELWMQPSTLRIFPDEEYVREGAKIAEDLSSCSLVFAVKEIPEEFFQPGKTYIFFSHTIKGQPYNMPMLKRMMELECNLIDYERIVDEKGQRLLFFGTQAGQAGMIDSLWALGQRIHYEKKDNPFFELRLALQYGSLVEAKEHIQKVGWKIHDKGLDPSLVPLICGFAGYGHVSLGAQQIFDLLPFEEISPEELHSFYESGNYASNRIYKVVFKEEHMVKPIASSHSFELQDYYDHPEKYQAILDTYLPYLTVLMNCIYWAPQYPHFVSKQFLRDYWEKEKSPHLRLIGDISCDVEGGVECTVRPTDPGNPVYVYDSIEEKAVDGIEGRGVVVMATDNLPAELPLESSLYFSNALMPLVPDMARADFSKSFEDCSLPKPVKKAVILYRGDFTPDYKYMTKFME